MKRRTLITAALTPLGVLGVAGVALAFWTVSSSGAAGSAAADSLGVPTVTTSDVTASNVTVNVTAAPTSGPTPTSYRVDRTAPGATVTGICSITGSTGNCADPNPTAGSPNSYSVYGQIGTSWVAVTPGTATANVPSADSTAPVTSASPSQAPNTAGWSKADVTVTLTATDAGSGVKNVTYSTSGSQVTGTTTTAGTTASVVISTAGITTVSYFATDNANNVEGTKTLVIKLDKTGPANAVALTGVSGGAFLTGGKTYYRGTTAGQFSLANTVTDALSGPASSTTSFVSASGWSHVPSTVTTLTSGAYVSNPFSWLSGTTTAPTAGVAGADAADNATPLNILFEEDHTGPSGGTVSVSPAGYTTATSTTVSFTPGADSQSGISGAAALLQRASAVDNHDGTCGTFGSFATIATAPSGSTYPDSGLLQGCYRYQYVVSDSVGNSTAFGPTSAVIVDTTAPTVSNVTSTLADGSYKAGQVVPVTVTFSEPVTVTGTPQLSLSTGSPATTAVNYASGSGTSTLTFNYTVVSGNTATDLDYASTSALALNSGTIRDAATNNATLTLATPGTAGSLGANKALVIDTTAPTVSNVTSTLADGSYKAGQVVPVTVTFSEPVTVTGTPQLSLSTGSPATTAVNYASGSGTSTLTFNYTVVSGNTATDLDYASTSALALNSGTIRDAATNNATLTLATPGTAGSLGANKALVIDTTAPTVSNLTDAHNSPNKDDLGGSSTEKTGTISIAVYAGSTATGTAVNTYTTTTFAGAASPFAWTKQTGGNDLTGGSTYTMSVTHTDAAGNVSAAVTRTFVAN
jgi:hypothetical protein